MIAYYAGPEQGGVSSDMSHVLNNLCLSLILTKCHIIRNVLVLNLSSHSSAAKNTQKFSKTDQANQHGTGRICFVWVQEPVHANPRTWWRHAGEAAATECRKVSRNKASLLSRMYAAISLISAHLLLGSGAAQPS